MNGGGRLAEVSPAGLEARAEHDQNHHAPSHRAALEDENEALRSQLTGGLAGGGDTGTAAAPPTAAQEAGGVVIKQDPLMAVALLDGAASPALVEELQR